MIDQRQNAFLKGRNIADSVLLMHDIVKGYYKNDGKARCVMKIDLMKAYDTVRWDFIFTVMELMKFPTKFIQWVKNGVCTAHFSLNLNGGIFHK